jgi:hypothetical protein
LLIRHPRRESHHAIIAATFLLCGNRKITPGEKRKVIDAFDERFSGKELTDWIKVIGKELEEEKWFEKHPQTVERKHKDEKRVLAKNISGVGIMVCLYVRLTRHNQRYYLERNKPSLKHGEIA